MSTEKIVGGSDETVAPPPSTTGHPTGVSKKSVIREVIWNGFNTINHVLIGTISIYMTFKCYFLGFESVTVQHTYFCTIGYQLLMAEAIMALYGQNVWSNMTTKTTKKRLHWIVQVVGSVMALYGGVIMYDAKSRQHFVSIHALTGFISLVFLLITCLNGLTALFSTEIRKYIKPVYSKLIHNSTAIICFVVGMVSLIYGYEIRFFARSVEPEEVTWLQIASGLTIVLSLIGVCETMKGHITGMFF